MGLLQLSSTLEKLGRFRDALPLLFEAQEAARTIACWRQHNRYVVYGSSLYDLGSCGVAAEFGKFSLESTKKNFPLCRGE